MPLMGTGVSHPGVRLGFLRTPGSAGQRLRQRGPPAVPPRWRRTRATCSSFGLPGAGFVQPLAAQPLQFGHSPLQPSARDGSRRARPARRRAFSGRSPACPLAAPMPRRASRCWSRSHASRPCSHTTSSPSRPVSAGSCARAAARFSGTSRSCRCPGSGAAVPTRPVARRAGRGSRPTSAPPPTRRAGPGCPRPRSAPAGATTTSTSWRHPFHTGRPHCPGEAHWRRFPIDRGIMCRHPRQTELPSVAGGSWTRTDGARVE